MTTATRCEVLPDVPPIGDFVSGYNASGWDSIGAPANTPPGIVAILNREVNATLVDPTFKARLADLGVEPFASSPGEFGKSFSITPISGAGDPGRGHQGGVIGSARY